MSSSSAVRICNHARDSPVIPIIAIVTVANRENLDNINNVTDFESTKNHF